MSQISSIPYSDVVRLANNVEGATSKIAGEERRSTLELPPLASYHLSVPIFPCHSPGEGLQPSRSVTVQSPVVLAVAKASVQGAGCGCSMSALQTLFASFH